MIEYCQSDVAPLKRVLIKHARDAFVDEDTIADQWRELGYTGAPDYQRAVREYDRFASLLTELNVEVDFLPADSREADLPNSEAILPAVGLDSMYTRDASIICKKGAILCNMGKAARRTEPATHARFFEEWGIPILGSIEGTARIEGGDVVWLDDRTLVVGRGYRTNDEGISQVGEMLADCIDEFIVVPLPHWRGPDDVFHLMSMISPLDRDLALVYSPLLSVPFRETLLDRGIQLIEVAEDEFDTLGCNVLAVSPRECVMIRGNPETRRRMQASGVTVHEFDGQEICLRGSGGPTCLTRPLVRAIGIVGCQ